MRRLRGQEIQSARDALLAYRLRPEDLAEKRPPFSREDLATIALKRHGSHAAMMARDASIRAVSKKRAETVSAREDRREDMHAYLLSIAESTTASGRPSRTAAEEYRQVCQWHQGMHAAVDRFVVKGTPASRDEAIGMFRAALDALRVRRAEVGSLPWPPAALVPKRFATCKEEYVDLGNPLDLADASSLSDAWSTALSLIGGGVERSVPAEALVDASDVASSRVRAYLLARSSCAHSSTSSEASGSEEASASASGEGVSSTSSATMTSALVALSEAYSALATAAAESLGPHPRTSLILRKFPEAIAPDLQRCLEEPPASDWFRSAARRVACVALELAVSAYCEYQWTTQIAPKLPTRIFTLDSPEIVRRLAEARMRRSFADPEDRRCDWADVAAYVLDAWSQKNTRNKYPLSEKCVRCCINAKSQHCGKHMCKPCCLLPQSPASSSSQRHADSDGRGTCPYHQAAPPAHAP
jgi:hypothetical protein